MNPLCSNTSLDGMDLEEWELVPEDGFLQVHDDDGKKIFSRKYVSDPRNVFEMNYFICPSPQFVESTGQLLPNTITNAPDPIKKVPKQLLPVAVHLEPTIENNPDRETLKQSDKRIKALDTGPLLADQDPISQVFFKKMKENEFVDMKVESPTSRKMVGAAGQNDPGTLQFGGAAEDEALKNEKQVVIDRKEENWEENSGGFNLWKWSMNGVGAICSFGFAAATVCVILFGGRQKNLDQQHLPEKIQFHLYTDDKRVKQVVQHANRLNEAITAARGIPITRAHIAFGGYYDGC